MDYKKFIQNGYLNLGEIIDKKKCRDLYKKIESSRDWGENLFRSENDIDENMWLPKTKYSPPSKTNPGKGKCNYSEEVDLSFIEKNTIFKKTIEDICGPDHEILLKKFVVATPRDWVPNWLHERMKKNYIDNLNPFIKNEYRDFTYFRGIDYHMDVMDKLNTKLDLITVYVYINDVTEEMSPLHVVNKSHKFCNTTFPHPYEDDDDKNKTIVLSDGNLKEKMTKEILTGNTGNVYLWSGVTYHRTKPFKSSDKPRISLRYTIKKNKDLKKIFIIDKFLEENKLLNFRNVKNNTSIITGNKTSKEYSNFNKNSNNKKFY
jgi:hypothetical protein